jgi:hypothetical protein
MGKTAESRASAGSIEASIFAATIASRERPCNDAMPRPDAG